MSYRSNLLFCGGLVALARERYAQGVEGIYDVVGFGSVTPGRKHAAADGH